MKVLVKHLLCAWYCARYSDGIISPSVSSEYLSKKNKRLLAQSGGLGSRERVVLTLVRALWFCHTRTNGIVVRSHARRIDDKLSGNMSWGVGAGPLCSIS